MEQEEKLCNQVEMAGEFTYFDDSIDAGGGCSAHCRSKCWVG